MTDAFKIKHVCVVCRAEPGAPCVEASEYASAVRDAEGQVVPGPRRSHGVYLARPLHLKRGAA